MKIRTGDFDVYENGTIIAIKDKPIDFIIDPQTDFILRMVMESDSEDIKMRSKAELFEKNGVKIIFTNYDNPLGSGNIDPIRIGTLGGKKLFLNYRIYPLEKSGSHIHYTFLLGEEDKSGK